MVFGRKSTFVWPSGPGTYAVDFPAGLRVALVNLAEQLDQNLESDHPDLHRLFPTAYNNDAERDAGYQILARPQLVDGKREAIAVVRETSEAAELDEEQLGCWMRVINDIRLVLGTRLDVSEEDFFPEPDDPLYEAHEVYQLMGLMLDQIVQAMGSQLP